MASGPIRVVGSRGSPTGSTETTSASASAISFSRSWGTTSRVNAAQASPLLRVKAGGTVATRRSSGASASTMPADFPPSSSVTRLSVCAATAAMR